MPPTEAAGHNNEGQQGELAAPPMLNISGDRVALGPLRRDLIPLYHRWFNDFAVRRTRVRPPRATTLQAQEREYDELATSNDRHTFTVYDRATWRPIDEAALSESLALAHVPDPDLLIRTGGEFRLSNFLLWQAAYTELYFCDTLWPDFDDAALDAAIRDFHRRERRFGKTSAQVAAQPA